MKKMIAVLVLTIQIAALSASAQTVVDVLESTIRVNPLKEEVLYYGFAEGDQLVFNFEEVNGRALKEVEILDMPSSSKFKAYRVGEVENKILTISHTGIYKFRLFNSSLSKRVCNVRIQRIPRDEASLNFNTSVYWRKVYDTLYYMETEPYLISTDTIVHVVTDQVAKVHPLKSSRGNKNAVSFVLPANTIAWSCYLGTDKAGQDALTDAKKELAKYKGESGRRIFNYSPMAAVALNRNAYISRLHTGASISYWVTEEGNSRLFLGGKSFSYLKKGKAVNDYFRMTTPGKDSYYLCLQNDQPNTAVQVKVNITAIVVKQNWGIRPVQKINVVSKEVAYLRE